MSKLSKTFLICGSIVLIGMDVWIIVSMLGSDTTGIFNSIMWNMVPCGSLLATVSLCTLYSNRAQKPLSIIASIVFIVTALIRALSLFVFVYDRITLPDLDPMNYTEYTKTSELAGYMILMVAATFLMSYLVSQKFKKVTITLSSIAFALIAGGWLVNIYNLINSALFYDAEFSKIINSLLNDSLVWNIILLVAYITQFACHIGDFEKPFKKEELK